MAIKTKIAADLPATTQNFNLNLNGSSFVNHSYAKKTNFAYEFSSFPIYFPTTYLFPRFTVQLSQFSQTLALYANQCELLFPTGHDYRPIFPEHSSYVYQLGNQHLYRSNVDLQILITRDTIQNIIRNKIKASISACVRFDQIFKSVSN